MAGKVEGVKPRMSARILVLVGLTSALVGTAASAAPLSVQAWPECKSLKPGARFDQAVARLGARGRRTGFAMVDDLPVAFYAFRRASRTCRVQIEDGMVLAAPTLR